MGYVMETIFLEEWLHGKIKQEAKESQVFQRFLGAGTSETLTRADVEMYQLFKLRKILSYVYEKSSFYKELFEAHGIGPEDIRSLADLTRLPFTPRSPPCAMRLPPLFHETGPDPPKSA
jgi:phenylacetate-CoA ligase